MGEAARPGCLAISPSLAYISETHIAISWLLQSEGAALDPFQFLRCRAQPDEPSRRLSRL
jgi:hypothetical protein